LVNFCTLAKKEHCATQEFIHTPSPRSVYPSMRKVLLATKSFEELCTIIAAPKSA
jgi:hypothetical protein